MNKIRQKDEVIIIAGKDKGSIGTVTKVHAHDDKNECGVGDTVRVTEAKPFSKTKHWLLTEIIEKSVSID